MANLEHEDVKEVTFFEKWHLFHHLKKSMFILTCNISGVVNYAPLYIHSFSARSTRKNVDSENFYLKYSSPNEITTISDKLRYYRYKKELLQRDVADFARVDRNTYIRFESGEQKFYPFDKLERISKLFEIKVTDLLDDYNAFIYNGQGRQIKALRKQMNLTQKEFGGIVGVHRKTVTKWEKDKVQILKCTYEKLIQIFAPISPFIKHTDDKDSLHIVV